MDTLEALGRGYSTLGAIVSSFIGISLIVVGNNIRVHDPNNSDKGKQMMLLGAGVGVVGVGIWYLAKSNKDIAAVEGIWLLALVAGGIVGAFKAHDNVKMALSS